MSGFYGLFPGKVSHNINITKQLPVSTWKEPCFAQWKKITTCAPKSWMLKAHGVNAINQHYWKYFLHANCAPMLATTQKMQVPRMRRIPAFLSLCLIYNLLRGRWVWVEGEAFLFLVVSVSAAVILFNAHCAMLTMFRRGLAKARAVSCKIDLERMF